MSRLPFTLEKKASGSKARATRFRTLHGEVRTPVFMPVGTQATVKGQTVETLKETGSSVLLANTYHLLLRPGPEVFERFGGIHRFMRWDRPVLTDSGGFQIFSLPGARVMNEDGARFKSYVDGREYLLSPESSIAMQRSIGSDIMMVLDQCIPSTAGYAEAETAMALTHRWARRSLDARGDSPQALFGIVQGACHPELRRQSAAFLRELPFDGLAIGGLAVGETHEERYRFTGLVTECLPEDKPRYLMGVGTPIDLLESVHRGVDMFDCIIPTQAAQRGTVFSRRGKLQLRRSVYRLSDEPIERGCDCHCCRHYTRGYLHHLVKTDETLGWHLLGIHNIAFYHRLMREMRAAIEGDTFVDYYERSRHELVLSDEDNPNHPPKPGKRARLYQRGDYEVVTHERGFSSIRQMSSGETMHSVNAPEDEARAVYVEQSCLAERLREKKTSAADWVIWDVGLGAASNAMAALHCFEREWESPGADAIGGLRLVSFERDLDPLRLAVRHAGNFPHLRHAAPKTLLAQGGWTHASGRLSWTLLEGDFLECLARAPQPDVIFYDPFSAKTDSALWTTDIFARVRTHCGERPAELYTYSCATAVRVALLNAGFFVAEGVGSGPKATTTVAFTHEGAAQAHPRRPNLLGEEWLGRWRRSAAQFPPGLSADEQVAMAAKIEGHPQFSRVWAK